MIGTLNQLAPSPARCLGLALALLATLNPSAQAHEPVRDDSGHTLKLATPARRIVSLAPHTTELLFAAGAGAQVIAVSAYSDYPAAAQGLPQVGSYQTLDLERIVALKPDLIVAWQSGTPPVQLGKLEALGIPVFRSEPTHLSQIPETLEKLGQLAGTEATAQHAATAFRSEIATLQQRYGGRKPLRVFYQIWGTPLMTLNGTHLVSEVMRLCGGQNVFATLPALAPQVTREAVLQAAPEVLLATQEPPAPGHALDAWRVWKQLPAVARGNLFYLDGNLINRPGPRLASGARQLCEALDVARAREHAPVNQRSDLGL